MAVVIYYLLAQKLQRIRCDCVRKSGSLKVVIGVIATLLLMSLGIGLVIGLLITPQSENVVMSKAYYTKAAISTDAGQCASVGKCMLEKNGSAVDAAIATLLCMGVMNPHSSGLGGGFIMTIYKRDEKLVKVLESREMAPQKATEDMFEGNRELAREGGLSVAVPGELAGYIVAWKQYGKLPWSELFQPAIEMCENGFSVGKELGMALASNMELIQNESSLRVFFWNTNTNDVYKEGETLRRPVLARTLRTLSKNITITTFFGDLEETLAEEIESLGGIITGRDFLMYTPLWKEVLQFRLHHNLSLYGVPPPGSGAILGFILNILDEYGFDETSFSSIEQKTLNYHRFVEACKYAFAERTKLDDQEQNIDISTHEQNGKLIKRLSSKKYAREIQQRINDRQTFKPNHYGIETFLSTDDGASHLSLVAPNGDAVSVSTSISSHFGSKRASLSTGIIFNNAMSMFSSPNNTSRHGLPPSKYNTISPGKRPLSSMSPTIVIDGDGNVRLVIGGTGGAKIISGAALVSALNLWAGKSIKEAICSRRLHHQLLPNIAEYESGFPQETLEGLQQRGHNLEERDSFSSAIMGIVGDKDGKLDASADCGRVGGTTDGF
ncbi:scoloptoxin SSD14-like isoform X2 [Tachypleus tridentatus]|uniref:scoloptoxin SSD14-like isoform X2 n=1 Tax=Tachypleus tridentatus TaxID=6853 RepID=UPI003FD29F6C